MRRALASGFILVALAAATGGWLAARPQTSPCASADGPKGATSVGASAVIAEPWAGRHHVYGVFVIPRPAQQHPAFVLLQGRREEAAFTEHMEGDNDVVEARVQTRLALRALLSGHFGDFRALCNWTLVLRQRPRRSS